MIGTRCSLRPYALADAEAVARLADDFAVARWMTAAFPFPYTLADARTWTAKATAEEPVDNFAIEAEGTLVGGAGLRPLAGECRGAAEFGYWLGRAYWGRGIATEAARLLVQRAFERGLRRLEAHVFAPNVGSARVLEKAGFRREGLLRSALVERDGAIVDGLLYARLDID